MAKPPEMEIEGVINQIRFAKETGFSGHLHICHTSTPYAVEIVNDARDSLRISCGSTPHHLMLSVDDMRTTDGMRFKVNPPLRSRNSMLKLRGLLRQGKIDWIETDHAPHRKDEKTYSPKKPKEFFMSGIRSLEVYSSFVQSLSDEGYSEEQIQNLTYANIKKVFMKVAE